MDKDDRIFFDALTWQGQSELPQAVPTALLYGKVPERGADVWIYLHKSTPALIWHSYLDDGEPDEILTVEQALEEAVPCPAFQLATTPVKLEALATYYFMRKKVAKKYDLNLTWEQKRLLNAMIGHEPPSKIVKLRVRIPEDHFLQSQPEHHLAREQVSDVIPRLRVSSRSTTSAHQLASSVSDANAEAKREPTSHASSGITSVESIDLIDRYLELEDQDRTFRDDMNRHEDRIKDLKRQIAEIEMQMEAEQHAAEPLMTQRDDREIERKRLFETMSKEDFRELGRRESLRKRPKHD